MIQERAEPVVRYVSIREGCVPASLPRDVVKQLQAVCPDQKLDRALDLASLVLVRLGHDAGAHALRHWLAQDPALIRDADPLLLDVLAQSPELVTGPLRG